MAWLLCALACAPGARPVLAQGVEAVAQPGGVVVPAEYRGRLPKHAVETGNPRSYRPLRRGPSAFRPESSGSAPLAAPSGAPLAAMPAPLQTFAALQYNDSCTGGQCGDGWPPDPNGDVGAAHYIEAVNSAYAIYDKTGTRLAAITENQLWSTTGSNPCNGNSQGDPVVIYDRLADRWILTHFAFGVSGSKVVAPFYQCIAASKTNDPVNGGWWLYPLRMDPGGSGPPNGDLNDYSKFGLWHDCLYMAANEFKSSNNHYDGVMFASFSRSDLYSGAPLTWAIGWLPASSNVFTMVPSNNQGSGSDAVQAGTPNYYVSESGSGFAFEVRKFTPGPNCGAGGTLGTATIVSQASYPINNFGNVVPQPNTSNKLDNIDDRIMQKVQYRKVAGVESLWVTHDVGTAAGPTAMQWAQLDVTGGTVATTPVQQQIHAPDTTLSRWMGSVAADRQGNMALGYSISSSSTFPGIAYAGRLASDPLNTLPQVETVMTTGGGSQTNNCGGAPCHRWGDYSAMVVDPIDECTFYYINEFYPDQANGTSGNWNTRVGTFRFPSCSAPSPVRIAETLASFGDIQSAYNGAADGNSLQAIAIDFPGSVVFGNPIAVTLAGGYNSGFTARPGFTAVSGSLTLSGGPVTVDGIVIH
jgi:hypothetical protein